MDKVDQKAPVIDLVRDVAFLLESPPHHHPWARGVPPADQEQLRSLATTVGPSSCMFLYCKGFAQKVAVTLVPSDVAESSWLQMAANHWFHLSYQVKALAATYMFCISWLWPKASRSRAYIQTQHTQTSTTSSCLPAHSAVQFWEPVVLPQWCLMASVSDTVLETMELAPSWPAI